MVSAQDKVADIVISHSECAPVFQRHKIDFCCNGGVSLEEAAKKRGVDAALLISELQGAISQRKGGPAGDARSLSTAALIGTIVATHHEYLRKVLPFLVPLAAKVGNVHGDHDPKLKDLARVVQDLSDAMIPHLDKEEQTLFPALMTGKPDPQVIKDELDAMVKEHLEVAALLDLIHKATDDYTLPDWACNSYRTLFAELESMESDILRHVHLENHVLMPRFTEEGAATASAN